MASLDGPGRQDTSEEEELQRTAQDDAAEVVAFSAGPPVSLARQRVLISLFLLILLALTARVISWTLPVAAQTGVPTPSPSEPVRGRIVDRNGLLMAIDTFVGKVYANPVSIADARNKTRATTAVISTSLTLDKPVEAVQASLVTTRTAVIIEQEATVQQCENVLKKVRSPDMFWCDFERERQYPQGPVAAHVMGFLNSAHQGLYGIEERYDQWLNSALPWPASLPKGTGGVRPPYQLYLPSPAGRDLVLNLDVPLQYVVERRLQEAIGQYQAEAGTIIMADPRTGAVLAMANYPTFDPGQYSAASSDAWLNPAISAIYEPGSVFKLVTMSAGLDSGYITPDSELEDEGALPIGGRVIKNAELETYGTVTIRDALARSINVISAKVSLRMGSETFYKYVRRFGFGRITEVDLAGEVAGLVPQPEKGSGGSEYDLAANSFGQGISVTPFQMINAVSAIANGGTLMQPQMVQSLVEDGEVHPLAPRILGRAIKPETARTMTELMVYTVAKSSTPDPVPGYLVAGKTGTAEVSTAEGYVLPDAIHSFIGFLPAADPQLIIMVKLVQPKTERWAEHTALPVFSIVGQDAVQILQIKPDSREP
jgi:cell division protein FtsI/penicillin-binding protein 2